MEKDGEEDDEFTDFGFEFAVETLSLFLCFFFFFCEFSYYLFLGNCLQIPLIVGGGGGVDFQSMLSNFELILSFSFFIFFLL